MLAREFLFKRLKSIFGIRNIPNKRVNHIGMVDWRNNGCPVIRKGDRGAQQFKSDIASANLKYT